MKERDKVSIIIPIYNNQQYITNCIDSVINQTYKNVEIILINDGSEDKSCDICMHYLQNYDNIKYFYQINQGVSVARNNGLELASGEFIFFLDSDDTINSEFIESSVKIANENNSDIVIVSLNAIPHKEVINSDYTWLSTCSMFLRKSFLQKYNDITFSNDIKIGEDVVFAHKLLLLTKNVNINNVAKYYYRKHESQSMFNAMSQPEFYYENIKKWFVDLEKFYEKYKLWESREYQISLFVAFACTPYLSLELCKNTKKEYFELLKNFVKKHKLEHFKTYNFSIINFLANQLLKCNNYQDFEIYLVVIKIFKYFKNYSIKKGI